MTTIGATTENILKKIDVNYWNKEMIQQRIKINYTFKKKIVQALIKIQR